MRKVQWRKLLGTLWVAVLMAGLAGPPEVPAAHAQRNACVPNGAEVNDNGIDEDCDGWLGTGNGYTIRAEHPRVLMTREMLDGMLARMTGPNARAPYSTWYDLIKAREDQAQDVDLVNLALIYKASGDATYLTRFLARRPTSGDPGLAELYAVDILWDDMPDEVKLNLMQRVSANDDCWYWNSVAESGYEPEAVSWGYHAAYGASLGLAYAGAFAYDDILQSSQVVDNPEMYNRFDIANYVRLAADELSTAGYFHQIENRIAGDPVANTALPGSYGGMYDNIGYDAGEEARSIYLIAEFLMLTGQDHTQEMLHDKYRASFYQNMQYAHIFDAAEQDRWCRRAGTEMHEIARIWYTQTSVWQPLRDAVALTANLYQDPRMQYYFHEGTQRVLCGAPYDGMWWDLIFYDDTLAVEPPETNPTATYFSGPGLVTMREDWSNDAVFAVFVAGEGISRRYEDANSFLLHRKTDIVPHAGARIRNNADNNAHHWYHVRSLAKNTLKIFDPDESFDIESDGSIGALHTGQPLVASDNFGGQIFETPISASQGCFQTDGCGSSVARYNCSAYPLGVCEVADVIKYEHVPDAYTYTVGDGTAAYTRKIDYFQREFLYLRPDVIVVFDRVQTVDAGFRKVWTIHTSPEPAGSTTPVATGHGMRRYEDETHITINHPDTVTYLDVLLPQNNRVTLRGGDTILASAPLNPGQPMGAGQVLEADIPRWLELFAVGSDMQGTITITGDAAEGNGVSEVITFDGTVQTYVSSRPTATSATTLQDSTQNWIADQWVGYVLRLRGGSGEDVLITGNDANTLQIDGGYSPGGVWGYYILRPLENSYYHWKRIDQITTGDMDIDHFTVSIPHDFDAENAAGTLYSFSPHTDAQDDVYRKRSDIGQWTVEVEASVPQKQDNFLHVFHLTDPGQPKVETQLVQGAGVSGAVVADWVLLFANTIEAITMTSVTVPQSGGLNVLFMDLLPESDYYYLAQDGTIALSIDDNGGSLVRSSTQGTALIRPATHLTLNGMPGNRAVTLNWHLDGTLPATTTWTIAYEGPAGDQPSPIAALPEATRTYELTGLSNYTWYTITLTTDPPLLADSIRIMPTNRAIYLPLVWR
ncbi:MAG: hypothetical protein ACOYYS_13620 [Chloroflexota bacterium]